MGRALAADSTFVGDVMGLLVILGGIWVATNYSVWFGLALIWVGLCWSE